MKEREHESTSNRSLLYLQLVFALFAGMLNVPLDLVGEWFLGRASPSAVGYSEFHLMSAVIFATITFCAWRWIIPHLRGVLVLRLLVQVMLGIVMFGYALMATFSLWLRFGSARPDVANQFATASGLTNLLVIGGATLYMILGGLSLGRASQEHSRLREMALVGQLEALRSQLNHHFLFNSLNVIAEAAAVQPERAEQLILQLASVLRYSLGARRARMAPLSEELAAVASYLELERARSGNRISVETEIAADVGGVRVPPMLIQPLVENAVGHGLMNGTCAGKISIAAWRGDNSLCLRVKDNGVGFDPNRTPRNGNAGVGLSNLRDRLHAFYGENAAFSIHSVVDSGTIAEISLSLAVPADAERAEHGIIWRTFFSFVGSIASVIAFAVALEVLQAGRGVVIARRPGDRGRLPARGQRHRRNQNLRRRDCRISLRRTSRAVSRHDSWLRELHRGMALCIVRRGRRHPAVVRRRALHQLLDAARLSALAAARRQLRAHFEAVGGVVGTGIRGPYHSVDPMARRAPSRGGRSTSQ